MLVKYLTRRQHERLKELQMEFNSNADSIRIYQQISRTRGERLLITPQGLLLCFTAGSLAELSHSQVVKTKLPWQLLRLFSLW